MYVAYGVCVTTMKRIVYYLLRQALDREREKREQIERERDEMEKRAKELQERMNRYQEENEKYQRGLSLCSIF